MSGATRERAAPTPYIPRFARSAAHFGEDGSMVRIGRVAENMSTLRRLVLNPLAAIHT